MATTAERTAPTKVSLGQRVIKEWSTATHDYLRYVIEFSDGSTMEGESCVAKHGSGHEVVTAVRRSALACANGDYRRGDRQETYSSADAEW